MNEPMNPEVKNKGGRPKGRKDLVPRKRRTDFQPTGEPGEIAKITAFNVKLMHLEKIDIRNEMEVENRIQLYFEECIKNDIRPGVAGLCLALGIERMTWYLWGRENRHGYADLVAKTRGTMEAILEAYMLNGKINPVAGIFLLKNHYGYRDQSDYVLSTEPPNPLGPTTPTEVLKRRYLDQKEPDLQAILDKSDDVDLYEVGADESGSVIE